MQIICPLLLATSWSLTDKDCLNPQSMSFNILYKSFLLIHKALAWFPPPWSPCWVAESCSGLSERQRRVCWKMLKAGHETAPALLPASLLQFAEAADFYFLLTDFFFLIFFIILYSPRLASFHFLMKSWFQVMWPSSGWSLVPCDLIQPYSYTSLLQEVFLLVKRRALRHQHVSRENALSWPNQPCLAGSSFPSWKTRLLPYCKLALAGVGRKPWQLSAGQGSLAAFPAVMHFTPKCTCYLEKRALLRRLCRVRGKEAAAVGFGRLCWGARAGTAGEAQPAVGASTKGGFAAAVPQCCF